MRFENYQLDVVSAATGVGAARKCEDMTEKTVVATGIAGGCKLDIEGTVDGVNWVKSSATGIAADGVTLVPETFAQVRVNRTVLGTGQPVATLAGRNAHTS